MIDIANEKWESGRNKNFLTVLDGKEGKCIYDEKNNVIGWANAENESGEIDIELAVERARIMAKAPDMYALLEYLADFIENGGNEGEMETINLDSIKALLKKARGEK